MLSDLHLLMQQNCKQCESQFEFTQEDLIFLEHVAPIYDGKKYAIPAPVLCPACRQRTRMAYRNERHLYKRHCDKCHKNFLSIYSLEKPFVVYCRDCWWSDDWNGTDYGQEFDFSKTFFEQYFELLKRVPQSGIVNALDENSDYTNYGYQNKDCYLTFTSDFNEKCSYGCFVWRSFECYDNLSLIEGQLCYECIDCVKCYASAYCSESENLMSCYGCVDCRHCESCFGSSGLRQKKYYFFNEPCSKEVYEQKVAAAKADWPETLKRFKEVGKNTPRRNLFLVQCENVIGDHLKNCRNCFYCFDCQELEDCKYMTNTPAKSDHCQDIEGAGFLSWSYQCVGTAGYHHLFSEHQWTTGSNQIYSSYSMASNNVFGCVGVKKGEYVILNKQYSKDAYEKMAARIIEHMQKTGEWGECFLPNFTRFAYNETLAQQYYPLDCEGAQKLGYSWRDEEMEKSALIPENVVICEVSGKPFRLTQQELEFYKKMDLPLPTKHPEIRMKERDARRNPRQLWRRQCARCQTHMYSSYSPDRPEIVYCEACYLEAVY